MPHVLVPAARWPRWVDNFTTGHGDTDLQVRDGDLSGRAADGSHFTAHLPFGTAYAGPADAAAFAEAAVPPGEWGVLLVRKGGFAVARLRGTGLVEHKIGQRHVQGRTKAGGQSQQRFARRRDNQARQAYEAAAEHAARILTGVGPGRDRGRPRRGRGGADRPAAGAATVVEPWLAVPDPRRAVLDQAVLDAQAIRVEVTNAG